MSENLALVPQGTTLSPVTRQDMEAMKAQRELLAEFVRSQLREADFKDSSSAGFGEGDYGIIPGTKKRCLLKPGAEKLLRLFNQTARFKLADKEVDRHANFALYTYTCEVVDRVGRVIATCDGTVNSQEKKYATRTAWKDTPNGRKSVQEETPIYDVLNTLQKMAQKRALIGAVLVATAGSDYFTQDVLEPEDVTPPPAGEKPPIKDVQSELARPEGAPPICCEKPMMISKYADKDHGDTPPWYCVKCKTKKARAA